MGSEQENDRVSVVFTPSVQLFVSGNETPDGAAHGLDDTHSGQVVITSKISV